VITLQLNGYLLTCILNSKSAYNKTSKKHKYNTKTVQIHKDKTLNKQNKNYKVGENNIKEVKGKEVPLFSCGTEGSRKLRFPHVMKTAQDGGKVVSLTHRPLYPQEMLVILIFVRG